MTPINSNANLIYIKFALNTGIPDLWHGACYRLSSFFMVSPPKCDRAVPGHTFFYMVIQARDRRMPGSCLLLLLLLLVLVYSALMII